MTRNTPRLTMLPLMDCIFLILAVFFLLILDMVQHRGIPLELPTLSTSQAQDISFVTISIDPNGGLFFDGQLIGWNELESQIRELVYHQPESHIFISADTTSNYGWIAQAIDAARQAGATHVALESKANDGA